MTQLVPQAPEIDESADLTEILRLLSEQDGSKPDAKALQTPSKPTNQVAVTKDALNALSGLQSLLRAVELPSSRRLMSPRERAELARLVVEAKKAVEAVNAATEGVREATFNHFDVTLENDGLTEGVKKDDKGHYLVKQEIYVESENVRLTRELREQAPEISAKDLRQAWQNGEISREAYMSMTKHVDVPREIDSEAMAAYLKKRPDLLPKVAKLIKPGKVSASFYVRPPKKDQAPE